MQNAFRSRFPRLFAIGLTLLTGTLASAAVPTYAGPIVTGTMEPPPRHETSGIAFSRRSPDLLWVHDDSGGQPILYAMTPDGKDAGAVRLRGVKNDDWEDVAAFERDGKAWLLVADTGDNAGRRPQVMLHLVEEPARDQLSAGKAVTVAPAWSMRLTYEDGPRDCESVAVDATGRAIYLLSKRDDIPQLYRVDLPARQPGNVVAVARKVGLVPHIPEPSAAEILVRGRLGKRRSEVTAMDFSSDGTLAAVLTYGGGLLFERKNGEPWPEALAREPVHLPISGLLQAEAICFTPDGKSIYVASEGPQPLLRYDRQ